MPRLTFPLIAGMPLVDLRVSATLPRQRAAGVPPPPFVTLRALVDTGAKRTCVDAAAFRSLGLLPVMKTAVRTASTGRAGMTRDVYDISVATLGATPVTLAAAVAAIAIDLSWAPYQCLLGRDVLASCRFMYDGPASRFELEF